MNDFFAGVDLGGTRSKIGLVADGKVIARKIVPAHSAGTLDAYLPDLRNQINQLIQEQQLPVEKLAGIGLAFPGLVDTVQKKIVHTNRKYDDAIAVDLEQWAQTNWGKSCIIDNDARMAAAGEWKYGAGKDCNDLVMVTIGTGIGTAVVMKGNLLRGKHFQAGILGGHFSIDYEGEQCICGNTGCAEMYGGSWNLPARVKSHPLYIESLLRGYEKIDFFAVFECAKQNDALALHIMQQSMKAWSATISNLILAYDPELVILGGGVMASADIIMPYIEAQMKKQAWSPWGTVMVKKSLLQEDAAILGLAHCLQELN
ncbi:MAG: ROK family protein [Chitinophagaceae bacterium]